MYTDYIVGDSSMFSSIEDFLPDDLYIVAFFASAPESWWKINKMDLRTLRVHEDAHISCIL